MTTVAPPARAEISATPSPSNAMARVGFGKLYDYVTNLLGVVGSPEAARDALDVPSRAEVQVDNNLIDNSNFAINQRGVTGTVTLAAGAYGHDRWKAGNTGCTYTFAKSGGVTTPTITAGTLKQVIDPDDFETGSYTLSHGGTAQMRYIDAGLTASAYSSLPLAVVAVAGGNLEVEFGVGTVKKVKLEPGTTATAWQFPRPHLDSLACERFATMLLTGGSQETLGMGFTVSATSGVCIVPLTTELQCPFVPTLTFLSGSVTDLAYSTPVGGTITSISSVSLGTNRKSLRVNFTGTGYTVGASLVRQNSGTPRILLSWDL